jgi:hypothetical protein
MPRPSKPPEFLIIGAQKCGTSWLHRHLSRHPELWLPPQKELEFFSYARHLEDPGLVAYRLAFEPAGQRLAGEATASYFWTYADSPWCAQPAGFQRDIPGTVRACLGSDLRLILLLRDPVERALSAWAHYVIHGELDATLPFSHAARYGGIVDMGFYGRHFAAWRNHFEADRFLLLGLERDVMARPEDTLGHVLEFLGCNAAMPSESNQVVANPVFPGLRRERGADGSVTIPLPEGGQLRASADDLERVAERFRPDLELLRTLVPDPDLGANWLPRQPGRSG